MEIFLYGARIRQFLLLFVAFAALVSPSISIANTTQVIDKKAANSTEWKLRDKEAQQTLDRKTDSTKPPIQLPAVTPLDAASNQTKVCFLIKHLQVTGFYSSWAIHEGQKLIGKCVGQESILSFVRVINEKLLHDGYVTSRATLPEQNISSGNLKISIEKGIVEKIVFPADYRFYWQNAFPIKPGDVLNIRAMEQGLEQLSKLQSQDVSFQIKPGSYDGASVIVVDVKQTKPWTLNLSVDDSGSDTTGEYPLTLGFSLDNALGIEDSLSYSRSYARKSTTGESNSESLSLDIPFGYSTLGLSISQFDYKQQAVGSVTNFILSGTGQDEKISFDHVLFRDNTIKAGWYSAVKKRQRRSYIDDTEIQVQRRNLSEFELGVSYRQYISRSVLDVSAGIHQGVTWFNADPVDPSAASSSAQPDYRFYSLNASLNIPIKLTTKQLSYTSQFWWQHAATPLYSIDWFNNGGRYTVRGYSSSESLSAENGWRSRNELQIPVSLIGFHTTQYIGLDIGQVSGSGSDDVSSKTLMGVALGLKGQVNHISYDAFISNPFLAHGPYATANDYKLNASLSMSF